MRRLRVHPVLALEDCVDDGPQRQAELLLALLVRLVEGAGVSDHYGDVAGTVDRGLEIVRRRPVL